MTQRIHGASLVSMFPTHLNGPAQESEQQHILVLGNPEALSPLLVAVCQALDIVLVPLRALHDLPLQLHQQQPIAVIGTALGDEAECCGVLRTIAAHDQDMPVMLMTQDEPAVLGAIDVAEQLWGLTAVSLVSPAQDPQEMVGFLFHATRWRNTGRFMPVV
jgi:hypothetical protein